jgi:hypothetical protein
MYNFIFISALVGRRHPESRCPSGAILTLAKGILGGFLADLPWFKRPTFFQQLSGVTFLTTRFDDRRVLESPGLFQLLHHDIGKCKGAASTISLLAEGDQDEEGPRIC